MNTEQALQTIRELAAAALQRGLFQDFQTAAAVNQAILVLAADADRNFDLQRKLQTLEQTLINERIERNLDKNPYNQEANENHVD